ncbi:MAG TPA: hypothetical protein VKV25_03255, partial [Acidimicrobiales bacterium]|nr:hypothetical protein [Acidimicrobiales bacterium]
EEALMALRLPGFGRRRPPDFEDLEDGLEDEIVEQAPVALPPTRMRGREPLQAYAIAAILAAIGLVNLFVTTGKGAPAHPQLWLSYVGIVLALFLAGTVQFRNRLISPFTAIVAAFFVTTARAPSALQYPHLVALLAALYFALSVALRQRRDQRAVAGTARSRPGRRGPSEAEAPTSTRPAANRRYTPPKDRSKDKSRNRR